MTLKNVMLSGVEALIKDKKNRVKLVREDTEIIKSGYKKYFIKKLRDADSYLHKNSLPLC